MGPIDIHGELTSFALLPSKSYDTSTDGTGVDISDYKGVLKVTLNAGVKTAGTNPTLSVKVQDSADNANFDDVTGKVFTTVTTTASLQSLGVDTRAVRKYIRAVATIGGTDSPAFPAGVIATGQKALI